MSATQIRRHAEMLTGLANWGEPDFLERMVLWLAALRSDTGLSDAGRASVESMALRFACGRLRLEALIAAHPEIEVIEIPAPIVITGLPRSGTTALATLLSAHPEIQSLRYRDVFEPFSGADQTRAAQHSSDIAEQVMPGLRRLHDTSALAHADDHWLQGLAFGGLGLEDWQAHLPKWLGHYLGEDQTPIYRYLKRALQALTFMRGSRSRWLIKSPQHVEQLPALKTVFPDAMVVVTTRPRRAVERSMHRFTGFIATRQRTRLIPCTYWPNRLSLMAARYARDRHLFPNLTELPLAEWSADLASTQQRIWSQQGV